MKDRLHNVPIIFLCVCAPLDRDNGISLKFGNIHKKLKCLENKGT
jgi:hypothetical protein